MTDPIGAQQARFGIFADLHHDIIHDGAERLQCFIDEMNEEKVDFIIQLGDLCHSKTENEPFYRIWSSFTGPKYHVLGNHDTEVYACCSQADRIMMIVAVRIVFSKRFHYCRKLVKILRIRKV